jgi:hypothetical protein
MFDHATAQCGTSFCRAPHVDCQIVSQWLAGGGCRHFWENEHPTRNSNMMDKHIHINRLINRQRQTRDTQRDGQTSRQTRETQLIDRQRDKQGTHRDGQTSRHTRDRHRDIQIWV